MLNGKLGICYIGGKQLMKKDRRDQQSKAAENDMKTETSVSVFRYAHTTS